MFIFEDKELTIDFRKIYNNIYNLAINVSGYGTPGSAFYLVFLNA